jgi:hypothetical protein
MHAADSPVREGRGGYPLVPEKVCRVFDSERQMQKLYYFNDLFTFCRAAVSTSRRMAR